MTIAQLSEAAGGWRQTPYSLTLIVILPNDTLPDYGDDEPPDTSAIDAVLHDDDGHLKLTPAEIAAWVMGETVPHAGWADLSAAENGALWQAMAEAWANRCKPKPKARLQPGVAEAVAGGESERAVEDLSLKSISDETSEVVRLVRSTLRDALKIGASDIHLETVAAGLMIKFRIDGILILIKQIDDRVQAEQAVARIKVLAELDVTERRVPQDGRFKAIDRNRAIDFRVSVMPSIHGEDAVLRVLDKQSLYEQTQQQLSLEELKAWGWRIPFVIGAAAAIVAMYLRRSLQETASQETMHHKESGSLRGLW